MPYQTDLFPMPLLAAGDVKVPEQQRELADVSEIFGEVIHSYTRRQAIEDGVLVDLMDPESDTAEMVREAGFGVPVALTHAVFHRYVWPLEDERAAAWLTERCQDLRGRLWDVLFVGRLACRAAGERPEAWFTLSVIVAPGVEKRAGRHTVRLKAVIGGDDDGAPCITIMLPGED